MLGAHAATGRIHRGCGRECATLTAKATVLRRSPYLCQCVTMSPISFGRSMRSASWRLDVVAGDCVRTPLQIGIDRRVDLRLHEEAAPDQVRDLRTFDHGLEDAAEPAPVATARRGGQAEQDRVGIVLDDLPDRSSPGRGALVDHQQIGGRQTHLRCGWPRVGKRLDRRRPAPVPGRRGLHAGLNDAVARYRRCESLSAGLRDDLAPMREHQGPLLRVASIVRLMIVGADDGLAAAGRRHQDDATLSGFKRARLNSPMTLV